MLYRYEKSQRGYVADLLERIRRILEYTQEGRDAFYASARTQDAVLRNFEVMGEIVKRLDSAFTQQHAQISWRSIAAFRDVIIHNYESLRMEVIWQTIADDLPQLERVVDALLRELPPDPVAE
jgi:uncharacterized protein with HEPN domain